MRISLTMLLAVLFVPASIPAQQRDTLRDTARVAPVVVTATRTPLVRSRVPASVTVLEGATLRAQGLTHVAEALRQVPGVAIVQSGSFGAQTSLFVRGGQNNYTRVLVDGVPLNDPGGALDLGSVTLDDVERIEVVRGPASVLYGSDAVTGVIQLFTRRGDGQLRGSIDVRGGTYGSVDGSMNGSGAAGPVRFSIGGAHHESDGIYAMNSQYRNDVGTAAVDLAPWAGAAVRLTVRHADVNAHFPTDFTGAPIDPNAFHTERRTLLGGELRQKAGAATATLALTSNLGNVATIDPPNGPGDPGSTSSSRVARRAAELRLALPLGTGTTVTAGGNVERQHQSMPDTARTNSAAFVELLHSAGFTTATAGLRFDHSGSFGEFVTYRVSVARLLPAGVRLRGTLGTAFREPSFFESFATSFSNANPALRPERTTSWEAGAEQVFGADRLTLGATYFSQRFVDLIDYRFDPSGSTYENVARARARGAEMELRATLGRGISADAAYTYLDTRVLTRGFSTSPFATLREDGPLLRRPRHSASAGIAVGAQDGASVDLRAAYTGSREDRRFHGAPNFDTEAVQLSPYVKLDAAATLPLTRFTARLRALSVTLRVDNVFATEYESVAGYATPARVIVAGLRASF